ncbi:spermidine/putrescine ABC transporter substrate-binding protein [Photobacterium kishitanii]|uniref:Putrescine-binding periplasmic protein n=1 Tax=Photobacterium kishitanii TaxID=318456 RepID=A0AAX0YWP6_9GAMM|nr:extracellular solute-binding protein [Photobacterium kishitanii]KJG11705.1 spermidine/putrescine ABC transporter substrate-binding protein [Photobacterium kishitanii]KJG58983.1 spermidine/putrescine ABC transporter substrate-binding protein [Photobacterium kishitanii]KJG62090.1 spermidine/putrescine ABC transporter substrate-binding protein [Photobacterium kishitanii]KJG67179.1 spermidine/putrescine ABC transporter substrate-binding protein [Photobacterium kishitanii]KJG70576.1 spermidine/p
MKKWPSLFISTVLLSASINVFAENTKDKQLVFMNWGPYISTELREQFTKETGIKVIYSTYESNETMYSKLLAHPSSYDLVVPSTYFVAKMRDEGMLQKIDKTKLTNFNQLDSNYLNKPFDPNNDYSIPHVIAMTGLAVNTDMYNPDDFDSWADLWSPELKGQLMLMDDTREVFHIALRKLGYSGNTTNPKEIDEAKEELKKLMPNVLVFNSDNPAVPYLAGEVGLGMLWNGSAAAAQKEGLPIKLIWPKEGGIFWVDSLAIAKNAQNVDAAHKMIDFLLRPDIAAQISEQTGYLTAVEKSNAKYKDNPTLFPPQADLDRGEWQDSVGEMNIRYETYFLELKANQ